MKFKPLSLLATVALLLPTIASAHPGHGPAVGLVAGFSHPMTGLDHILTMVLVGVFAAQLSGRALWLVPAAFVAMMGVGGALGMYGVGLPFVETGIAVSVIVMGAVVALGLRAPVAVAMALVGVFAVFHGHAHGAEMPANTGGLDFALGFMVATATLHAIGIALTVAVLRLASARSLPVLRTAGGLAAVAGLGLLTGTI
ncbi:MAG: urease accessory protein [Limimaricola sp.]|uniref:HupE/UreJ family protein n=1 Tax=Limimaricola sp. TaxID=2211665 RepID=UPI001D938D99|nr:HupE/UreJ family protein [Limimaricola sp.]MBI1416280.1 urease accessory protein [Limimaricola sp.]